MSKIERAMRGSTILEPRTLSERLQLNRTGRALAAVEHGTVVRLANVQSEGMIATEKIHEVNHAAREGVTSYSLLYFYATAASAGDPLLLDELKLFKDTARLGSAEVVADLVDAYCRESRR